MGQAGDQEVRPAIVVKIIHDGSAGQVEPVDTHQVSDVPERADACGPLLARIDYVNCMGVNPGFSGQSFIPETLPRLAALRDMLPADDRGRIEQTVCANAIWGRVPPRSGCWCSCVASDGDRGRPDELHARAFALAAEVAKGVEHVRAMGGEEVRGAIWPMGGLDGAHRRVDDHRWKVGCLGRGA